MALRLMQYTCCFIVFTSCVDQGDGRWKKRDKKNLRHDIDVFRKLAEKIDDEIEALYEDYPIQEDYIENTRKHLQDFEIEVVKKTVQNFSLAKEFESIKQNGTSRSHEDDNIDITEKYGRIKNNSRLINGSNSNANWPKFGDILLEVGKRYDWKNDRWIKVKGKLKGKKKLNNTVTFLKKHKFSYRIVKLNKKSRRNVVIAVSAVR